uniref:GPI ethanolamine phosphate transferase 3 n=1 Tax=Chaetoceros debilis TaxID=122233 RepID=A0A7S3Q9B3_9STRA
MNKDSSSRSKGSRMNTNTKKNHRIPAFLSKLRVRVWNTRKQGHAKSPSPFLRLSSRQIFLLVSPILSLIGLVIFMNAFFLAKKSLPHMSSCEPDSAGNLLTDILQISPEHVQYLHQLGILSEHRDSRADDNSGGDSGVSESNGCWMPRRVDAMAIIVVDALRFDFALQHLPKSVGSRLSYEKNIDSSSNNADTSSIDVDAKNEDGDGDGDGGGDDRVRERRFKDEEHKMDQVNVMDNDKNKPRPRGLSQLYKFVADPPTVTMQRLKGLTTGGLPTFADITGNFGGAYVDEDNFVQQLHDVPAYKRGMSFSTGTVLEYGGDSNGDRTNRTVQMAFVGDDTWVDLYPNQFDDSHPFPSFNTRDLDTVDDGCLLHLPRLLKAFGYQPEPGKDQLEDERKLEMDEGSEKASVPVKSDQRQHQQQPFYEVLVSHFLGVDHVGHTYGPHNEHMDKKLGQMDDVLSNIFMKIDNAPPSQCQVAFVFGDHGMTEQGSHGGGTDEETGAALFAHYSPGCGDMGPSLSFGGGNGNGNGSGNDNSNEIGAYPFSQEAFRSIHQIDLVPTISVLLGLPIPYANLGGAVPALLPPLYHRTNFDARIQNNPRGSSTSDQSGNDFELVEAPFAATTLALNAAQVWNYLSTYSSTANKLPPDALADLAEILQKATAKFNDALSFSRPQGDPKNFSNPADVGESNFDSTEYREACSLYKYFLSQATDLGKKVWTRFDTVGMSIGIGLLVVSVIFAIPSLFKNKATSCNSKPLLSAKFKPKKLERKQNLVEGLLLFIFLLFQCILLTFSNSYIVSEESIAMFMISTLCAVSTVFRYLATTMHGRSNVRSLSTAALPMIIMFCSRLDSLFVSGHGMDPIIRKFWAHSPYFFLPSLAILAVMRYGYMRIGQKRRLCEYTQGRFHMLSDMTTIGLLGKSWVEKRSVDLTRHGYKSSMAALILSAAGLMISARQLRRHVVKQNLVGNKQSKDDRPGKTIGLPLQQQDAQVLYKTTIVILKILLLIVTITGSSAAPSSVFLLIQAWALLQLMFEDSPRKMHTPMLAAIWRLVIRHTFFATGHTCSFEKVQFSAAFVATDTFHFYFSGSSLFLNTFGWDIVGIFLLSAVCKAAKRPQVYTWVCFYQLLETTTSCISVTLMRRHLFGKQKL